MSVSIVSSVEAFISTVGAVISKVVPAFTSRWPSADANIFSPPPESWKEILVVVLRRSSLPSNVKLASPSNSVVVAPIVVNLFAA